MKQLRGEEREQRTGEHTSKEMHNCLSNTPVITTMLRAFSELSTGPRALIVPLNSHWQLSKLDCVVPSFQMSKQAQSFSDFQKVTSAVSGKKKSSTVLTLHGPSSVTNGSRPSEFLALLKKKSRFCTGDDKKKNLSQRHFLSGQGHV